MSTKTVSDHPLFRDLCASVARETRNFTFACGGSIPIVPKLPELETKVAEAALDDEESTAPPLRYSTSSIPIDLRWDSKEITTPGHQTKITFPLTPETEPNLARLVADCAPATFGKGNKDVLDESYRKASKMEPTQFSSTFNPHEVGIVDTVAQALLPLLYSRDQMRSLKAELYKLNFYSAPSGKFIAHVDTPRSSRL